MLWKREKKNVNQTLLSGTIVSIMELKPEENGKESLCFLLDVDQWVKKDNVMLITVWDNVAQNFAKMLSVGDKILATCSTHSFKTKELDHRGKPIYKQYTHGHSIEYLSKPKKWQDRKDDQNNNNI